MSNINYIFKENGDNLEFVGDFDSLYANEKDPWNQSGETLDYGLYYTYSRDRLNNKLKEFSPNSILDVGCGLGYTTQYIQEILPDCHVTGMDISNVAIKKANKLFSNLEFITGDISSIKTNKKYDVIILNQLLWYILESLTQSLENCFPMLNTNGRIIISQAFLKTPQRYGTDICNGFDGLINFLDTNTKHMFDLEYSNYDDSNTLIHNDGIVSLSKRSNIYRK